MIKLYFSLISLELKTSNFYNFSLKVLKKKKME